MTVSPSCNQRKRDDRTVRNKVSESRLELGSLCHPLLSIERARWRRGLGERVTNASQKRGKAAFKLRSARHLLSAYCSPGTSLRAFVSKSMNVIFSAVLGAGVIPSSFEWENPHLVQQKHPETLKTSFFPLPLIAFTRMKDGPPLRTPGWRPWADRCGVKTSSFSSSSGPGDTANGAQARCLGVPRKARCSMAAFPLPVPSALGH